MKKKVILTSALAMLMAGSLMAGATYAMFTSESKTDLTVSAGTVDVRSAVLTDTIKLTSRTQDMPGLTFANGGTANLVDNKISLEKMTPGDKVSFDIEIKNYSTVNVKFRTAINCIKGYKLYSGLIVTFDGEQSWTELAPEANPENPVGVVKTVTIEMPEDLDNEYQGLNTELAIAVEAVQANADVHESIVDNVVKSESASREIASVTGKSAYLSTPSESVEVRVPKSRIDTESATELKLSIKNVKQPSNFIVPAGKSALFYDIDVQGIKADGYSMDVKLFVGKGLHGWTTGATSQRYLTVLHEENGQIEEKVASYDEDTGYIKFSTGSFSVFGICAEKGIIYNAKSTPELSTLDFQRIIDENSYVALNSDLVLLPTDTGASGLNPTININHDLELNLNGHTISYAEPPAAEFASTPSIFSIATASKVIVNGNGKIDAEFGQNGAYCFNLNNVDADLYIKDGEYYGGPTAIQSQKGTLNVYGGKFGLSKTCSEVLPEYSKYVINCIDKNYPNGDAKIRLIAGEFINFNPVNPNNEKIKAVYVIPGTVTQAHEIDENNTIYETMASSDFEDKIEAAGTFTLDGDVYMVPRTGAPSKYAKTLVSITKPATIDLNNHNILMDAQDPNNVGGVPIMFKVSSELTIRGNGRIDSNIVGNNNSAYNMLVDGTNAVVNIEGGDFRAHTTSIQVDEGTLNIKGGTFDFNDEAKKNKIPYTYLINCMDRDFTSGVAKINVTGGKFTQFNPADVHGEPVNPTSYLAAGYEVKNENDVYTVVKTVTPIQ